MYSKTNRQNVVDKLVAIFSNFNEVNGIYLVGSNARGDADIYSDVDISIIIEDDSVEKLWKAAERVLLTTFTPFRHFNQYYNEQSFLIGLCLDNGLEVDIGFCSKAQFIKQKTSRKGMDTLPLFSKDNFILPEVQLSISKNVSELIENRNNDLWYDFTNSFIALKRNQLFRAANGIESIRSQLLEIYAKAKGLEHKHYRHIDMFEKELKEEFLATYSNASLSSFKESLERLLEIFLKLLKEFGRGDEAKEYQEHFERFVKEIKL